MTSTLPRGSDTRKRTKPVEFLHAGLTRDSLPVYHVLQQTLSKLTNKITGTLLRKKIIKILQTCTTLIHHSFTVFTIFIDLDLSWPQMSINKYHLLFFANLNFSFHSVPLNNCSPFLPFPRRKDS